MDFKPISVALIVLLAGLVYNSLANDPDDDSIDSLIERLEHVLELQARSGHELDDITDDIGEDELESIDGELSNLRKRWLAWTSGKRVGLTSKRTYNKRTYYKKPSLINSKRRLKWSKQK